MAILSKRLNLVSGIWQLASVQGIVVQREYDKHIEIETVNADALPVGDIAEAVSLSSIDGNIFPAPLTGGLYVRSRYGNGNLNFYEIV